jgi:hypothetical protein
VEDKMVARFNAQYGGVADATNKSGSANTAAVASATASSSSAAAAFADADAAFFALKANISVNRRGLPRTDVAGFLTYAVRFYIASVSEQALQAVRFVAQWLPATTGPNPELRAKAMSAFAQLPQTQDSQVKEQILMLVAAAFSVQPGTVMYMYSATSDAFVRCEPLRSASTLGDAAFTPCAELAHVLRAARISGKLPGVPLVISNQKNTAATLRHIENFKKALTSDAATVAAMKVLITYFARGPDAKRDAAEAAAEKRAPDGSLAGIMQVQCYYCGRHAWHEQTRLRACGGCARVSYCSQECQASDWKGWHKMECKTFKAMADDSRVPVDRRRALLKFGIELMQQPITLSAAAGVYEGAMLLITIGGPRHPSLRTTMKNVPGPFGLKVRL